MKVTFYKYHGTGNDFIILDDYNSAAPVLSKKQVKQLCNRHFSIGADGLMLLSKREGYDFEMQFYNSDGNQSTMCGNGGRCLVKFAHQVGIHKSSFRFYAIDGEHEAEIDIDGTVSLKMQNVSKVEFHNGHAILNTGSPHYVKFVSDINSLMTLVPANSIAFLVNSLPIPFVLYSVFTRNPSNQTNLSNTFMWRNPRIALLSTALINIPSFSHKSKTSLI